MIKFTNWSKIVKLFKFDKVTKAFQKSPIFLQNYTSSKLHGRPQNRPYVQNFKILQNVFKKSGTQNELKNDSVQKYAGKNRLDKLKLQTDPGYLLDMSQNPRSLPPQSTSSMTSSIRSMISLWCWWWCPWSPWSPPWPAPWPPSSRFSRWPWFDPWFPWLLWCEFWDPKWNRFELDRLLSWDRSNVLEDSGS